MEKFVHALAIILAAQLCLATTSGQTQEPQAGSDAPGLDQDAHYSLNELKMFARLFQRVRHNYVEEVSDSELFEIAIRGMLNHLDPHSQYLNEEQRQAVQNASDGAFYGVGLELTMKQGELIVITPLDDSPAARANLRPGDLILEVDGQSVWGMNLGEALSIMKGEPETQMRLLVTRDTEPMPFEVVLVRERISLESVHTRMLTETVGYVRIRQFQRNTGPDFREKLGELLEVNSGLAGLILDLRNNPGGILQAAVEVSDAFLTNGLIVTTKGRVQESTLEFFASPDTIAEQLPLVILINQGSASASEIVAGALQDQNRALIMGEISFGKGSIQNVIPIDDTRAIKLTTARYYTPSGRSIQAQGIYPDVVVPDGEITREQGSAQLSESTLHGHLRNEDPNEPQLIGLHSTLAEIDDLQLAQAVAFLTGLTLYQRQK